MNYKITANGVDLTKELASDRMELAYSTVVWMAEHDTKFQLNGEMTSLVRDQIQAVDGNGKPASFFLDPELFGTEEDNEKAKEEVFQKYKQEVIEEIGADFWVEDIERGMQEPYTVNGTALGKIPLPVHFAPVVWNMDKANDMYNLMHYGMADGLTVECERDGEKRTCRVDSAWIANTDSDVYEAEDDPEWVKGNPLMLSEEDLQGLTEDVMTL